MMNTKTQMNQSLPPPCADGVDVVGVNSVVEVSVNSVVVIVGISVTSVVVVVSVIVVVGVIPATAIGVQTDLVPSSHRIKA